MPINDVIIVEVVERGLRGKQGISGGPADFPLALDNPQSGDVLVFDAGESAWTNAPPTGGGGTGDMTKAVYDTDNDGKVDNAEVADAVAWTGVIDPPDAYPPEAHGHDISDVTGLAEALAAPVEWDNIDGVPQAFPPNAHDHVIADVTGLVDALAEKADAAAVTNALASKADADAVTEALASKAGLASPAFTGAPKAPTAGPGSNTDQIATTAFVGAAIGAIPAPPAPEWDDIEDKPETFPPAAHGHAIGDVGGLGDALAAKADASAIPAPASAAVLLAGTDNAAFATAKSIDDANAPLALVVTSGVAAIDLAARVNFTLDLSGNTTLAAPTNARPGQTFAISLTRPASETLSFAAAYVGIDNIDLPSGAGKGAEIVGKVVSASPLRVRVSVGKEV